MSDPFEQLRYDSPSTRSLIRVQTEEDLNRAELQCRERYIDKIKERYRDVNVGRVANSLRMSILKEALIETSKGFVKRDPVCVYLRPIYDEITCLAYAHTDEVINQFRRKGAVIDLGHTLATRENLETVFGALRPLLFCHCGHGTNEALLGQDSERVIDSDNVHLLRGCFVSAMACHSHGIAELAIRGGCIGFHGYKSAFRVMSDYTVARLMLRILRSRTKPSPKDFLSAERYASEVVKQALIHDMNSIFAIGDMEARIASHEDISRKRYYQLMAQKDALGLR